VKGQDFSKIGEIFKKFFFVRKQILTYIICNRKKLEKVNGIFLGKQKFDSGARYLMGENLKLVWAEFSTLS
jgi:hypothetical protein